MALIHGVLQANLRLAPIEMAQRWIGARAIRVENFVRFGDVLALASRCAGGRLATAPGCFPGRLLERGFLYCLSFPRSTLRGRTLRVQGLPTLPSERRADPQCHSGREPAEGADQFPSPSRTPHGVRGPPQGCARRFDGGVGIPTAPLHFRQRRPVAEKRLQIGHELHCRAISPRFRRAPATSKRSAAAALGTLTGSARGGRLERISASSLRVSSAWYGGAPASIS